jgi:hypothetical protein
MQRRLVRTGHRDTEQSASLHRGRRQAGGEHGLSRRDVGAEIEDLRLASRKVHAFDAGVDAPVYLAGGQCTMHRYQTGLIFRIIGLNSKRLAIRRARC